MINSEFDLYYALQKGEEWALEALDNLVKDKIKYRWHDLRKNPNDLPPHGKVVLLKTAFPNQDPYGFCYVTAWYNEDEEEWGTHSQKYYPERVAWKYIEPFVEEREE